MPDHVSATIQEVTEDVISVDGKSQTIRRKYKTAAKQGPLELCGKHLKLFTDKTELSGPDGESLSLQVEFVKPKEIPHDE